MWIQVMINSLALHKLLGRVVVVVTVCEGHADIKEAYRHRHTLRFYGWMNRPFFSLALFLDFLFLLHYYYCERKSLFFLWKVSVCAKLDSLYILHGKLDAEGKKGTLHIPFVLQEYFSSIIRFHTDFLRSMNLLLE